MSEQELRPKLTEDQRRQCIKGIEEHAQRKSDFFSELEQLLNKYSVENGSNTPDFIVAQYLLHCLQAFNSAVNRRETWYGRRDNPASV